MSYFKENIMDSENENSLNADEMNMKQSNDQVGTIYKTMIWGGNTNNFWPFIFLKDVLIFISFQIANLISTVYKLWYFYVYYVFPHRPNQNKHYEH